MKIVVLEEAQRQFETKDAWWQENRDEKDLFADEFEQALRRIVAFPTHGQQYRVARGKQIQRVLMKKTLCHVYYWYGDPNVSGSEAANMAAAIANGQNAKKN